MAATARVGTLSMARKLRLQREAETRTYNQSFANRYNKMKALLDLQEQLAGAAYRRPPLEAEMLRHGRPGGHLTARASPSSPHDSLYDELKRKEVLRARKKAAERARLLRRRALGLSTDVSMDVSVASVSPERAVASAANGSVGLANGDVVSVADATASSVYEASPEDAELNLRLQEVMEKLRREREASKAKVERLEDLDSFRRTLQKATEPPAELSRKRRLKAVVTIQRVFRGYMARKRYAAPIRFLARRRMVAQEIFDTERKYVDDLKLVREIFLRPMRERGLLKDTDIRALFGNLEELISINSVILGELVELMKNWGPKTLIGPLFVQTAPFLKSYMPYCSNYQHALQTLNRLRGQERFMQFLGRAESDPRCCGLQLVSFLITPVQRIPRYELLLRELRKTTRVEDPDYEQLSSALQALKGIAEFVNEGIRTYERSERVFRIQQVLSGYDMLIQPGRICLKEGSLFESKGGGSARLRHVFLFNDILVVTSKSRMSFSEKYNFKYLTDLRQAEIIPKGYEDMVNSFTVVSDGLTVYYAAESGAQRRDWFNSIQEAIDVARRRTFGGGRSGAPDRIMTSPA